MSGVQVKKVDGMKDRKEIMGMVAGLVGNANSLVIPVAFIKALGDKDSAMLLSQCLYWTGKSSSGDEWFYKSDADWRDELYMTKNDLIKAKNKLKSLGLIEVKIKKVYGDPTCHYRVSAEVLIQWLFHQVEKGNSTTEQKEIPPAGRTCTESTTKITSIEKDQEKPDEGKEDKFKFNNLTDVDDMDIPRRTSITETDYAMLGMVQMQYQDDNHIPFQ